jgi:hypothetical protein
VIGGTALRAGAGALALILLASVPVVAQAAPGSPAQTSPSASAAGKSGPLSPRLEAIAGDRGASSLRLAPSADPAEGVNTAPGGRLYVDVRVDAAAALAAADALPGVDIEATTPDGAAATLAVPTGQLLALGDVTGLVSADAVPAPQVDRSHRALRAAPAATAAAALAASTCPSGTTVSQGSAQLKVPSARSTYGVDGTGVKIGIISDSYGTNKTAAASQVRAGDLPGSGNPCGHTKPVKIVADQAGTDEGRAMAQIVHDLAPGAELLFADSGASQIEMANHVRALRDAGAQVIVDDISYLDSTMYQDGFLAAAVDEVVADGVTYLSSAGNQNLTVGGKSVGSYETQAFRPTACPAAVGTRYTCHDFNPTSGVTGHDIIVVPPGSSLYLNLGWNQPMYGVESDLDLFVLDSDTMQLIDVGGNDNRRNGRPIEWAGYENDTRSPKRIRIVVGNDGNVGTPRFKSVFYSPGLDVVQWNTSTGGDVVGPTLFGHAASRSTIAVGAMTKDASPAIESYSSRGPATSCWEPSHGLEPSAAIAGCATKTVDVLGTDGVATTVSGFNPFYGTSAAAPHVAAVAALMVDRAPCASPAQIRAALHDGAIALGSVHAGGSGRTDALASLGELDTCSPLIGAPAAPKVVSVSPTYVRVTVSAPAIADSPTYGYEAQLIRPGGEVVTTASGTSPTASTSFTVDLPVAPGEAYRVRARTTHLAETSPWSPSSVLIVPPFASADLFMSRLSTDFSSRTLTDDERQTLTFVLGDDYGPAYAAALARQFDPWAPKIDPVIRLFYAYFGRKPDPSGLNYWLTRRRSGVTLDKISSTFAASSEFKTKYGTLSNNAFVKLVYQNVLGRSGDAGGISYWTKQLDAKKKDRGQVMTGFSESSEHLRRRVGEYVTIDFFFGMLRRVPTTAEMAEWVPVVAAAAGADDDGQGILDLAQHLLTSPEYLARVS